MNIFEALRESHDLQRNYCRRLLASRKGPGREALFLQLKVELKSHAAAEERFLYVPLLMTDGGLDSSRHALKEHHEIEEMCDDLSVADKGTAAWLAKFKELAHEVRHHLKEEENKFFQVAGKQIPDAKKEMLGGKYVRELVRMRRKYADEYQTVEVDDTGVLKGKGRAAGIAPPKRSPARKSAARTVGSKGRAVARKTAAASTRTA